MRRISQSDEMRLLVLEMAYAAADVFPVEIVGRGVRTPQPCRRLLVPTVGSKTQVFGDRDKILAAPGGIPSGY